MENVELSTAYAFVAGFMYNRVRILERENDESK